VASQKVTAMTQTFMWNMSSSVGQVTK